MNTFWQFLAHSLVFSVYPILFLYSVNIGQMRFFDAAVPALVSLGTAAAALIVLNWLLKSMERAALLVSGFCFMFYAYGAFDETLRGMFENEAVRSFWLPVGWVAVWLVSVVAVIRSRSQNEVATKFLSVVALVLLMFLAGNIVSFHVTRPGVLPVKSGSPAGMAVSEKNPDVRLPDIYYLILDGYARNDTMQDVYGYDNSSFTSFLTGQGFYVASGSHANYGQTYLSLASSLNLTYLDHLAADYAKVNTVQPLIEMISNNQLFACLKKNGYLTMAFSSGYSGTELRNADIFQSRSMLSREFFNILINSTFLLALKFPFLNTTVTQADKHRERIIDTCNSLGTVRLPNSPVAVFAHILCPHPPFVFGPGGEKVALEDKFNYDDGSHWGTDHDKYRRHYKDQLIYINSLVKKTISQLQADSSRSRIIILQSDHGPGSGLLWQKPEESDLRERMAILNAIYFPDGDYRQLYPTISPVNTFRVILNRLFRADMPLLEDRSYFSRWWGRYQFTDVTNRLK